MHKHAYFGSFTKPKSQNRNQGSQRKEPSIPPRKHTGRTIGVIPIEIFNQEIPVFLSDSDRVLDFTKRGIPCEPVDRPYLGLATWSEYDDGSRHFSMVLAPESEPSTWLHESSHIIDFIFDYLGIPTGIESTELRAYLTGFFFDELVNIMKTTREKYPQFF